MQPWYLNVKLLMIFYDVLFCENFLFLKSLSLEDIFGQFVVYFWGWIFFCVCLSLAPSNQCHSSWFVAAMYSLTSHAY